jgi:hypothetical protein
MASTIALSRRVRSAAISPSTSSGAGTLGSVRAPASAALFAISSARPGAGSANPADSHDDATCWAARAPAPSTHQDGSASQILVSGEE